MPGDQEEETSCPGLSGWGPSSQPPLHILMSNCSGDASQSLSHGEADGQLSPGPGLGPAPRH